MSLNQRITIGCAAVSMIGWSTAALASDNFYNLKKTGDVAFQQEKYKQAEQDFSKALDVAVKHGGKNKDFADMTMRLANVYAATKRYDRAERNYQNAEAIYKRIFGRTSLEFSSALHARAELYRRNGKFEKAIPLYKQALRIRATNAQGHTDLADTSLGLAKVYLRLGKDSEAAPLLKQAAEIQEKAYGKSSHQVAITYRKLAQVYDHLKKPELAAQMYRKTITASKAVYGPKSAKVASASEHLAQACAGTGKYKQAADAYREAVMIRESISATPKATMKRCLQGYARVLKKLNKAREAKAVETKLARLK